MSAPRILLTTDLVGGVWDFCLALVRALDADVTLLALGAESAAHRAAAADAGADIVFAPRKLEWMAGADISSTVSLVETLVRELRPDILHTNQFAPALADLGVPIVLTLHSDVLSWRRWTLGAGDVPPEWRSYARLVSRALRRADRIVAVSGFLAGEVHELYSCRRGIDIIYNGWPAMSGAVHARRGTLLAGRAWDSAKNIQLAAYAAHGWEPGEVYLAGDQRNPESGSVMSIDAPIRRLGQLARSELDERLRRTAIYLSPARYDPFGLLPLQAALHGAALLLSDIPSYRELWDGVACFFRSDDAGDLRRHWQRLLNDSAERSALAQAAYVRARNQYSATAMAEAYERLYSTASRSLAA